MPASSHSCLLIATRTLPLTVLVSMIIVLLLVGRVEVLCLVFLPFLLRTCRVQDRLIETFHETNMFLIISGVGKFVCYFGRYCD